MAYINVDEVYILDNTGLQVDMATDIPFVDAGFTDAQKEQARKNIAAGGTNPNLLDNPWFTVNQRGQTSYSAGYSVDRWSVTSNASINVLSNGIELTTTANRWGMEQRRVKNLIPHGTTVTFSALIDDGEIVQKSFVWNGASTTAYPDGSAVGLEINTTPTTYDRWYVCNTIASTHIIHAVKIEVGSVSTLANDTPPDYGEELRKCKQYFRRITNIGRGRLFIGIGFSGGVEVPNIFGVGNEMRKTTSLTVTYSGSFAINAGTDIAVTNITKNENNSNFGLSFTASGITPYTLYSILGSAGAYIDISADL